MTYQVSNDIELSTRPEGHELPHSFQPRVATAGLEKFPKLQAILARRAEDRQRQEEQNAQHFRMGRAYWEQLTPNLRQMATPLFLSRLQGSTPAARAFAEGFLYGLKATPTASVANAYGQGQEQQEQPVKPTTSTWARLLRKALQRK